MNFLKNNRWIQIGVLGLGVLLLWTSCSEPVTYPRKHGFYRIDFPTNPSHTVFESPTCPFTFEYPDYGKITRANSDSCWVDIDFPRYSMKWHLSYKDTRHTGKKSSFHFEEHRKLIYKHTKKATEIRPSELIVKSGKGTIHEVYGSVGTPAYYFVVDSTDRHVLMLSLYFNTALKNDSLAPIIDYMKGEALHAMETIVWE